MSNWKPEVNKPARVVAEESSLYGEIGDVTDILLPFYYTSPTWFRLHFTDGVIEDFAAADLADPQAVFDDGDTET